ncbi:hypothetical protein D3Z60_14550 [Lachnospiraceae bacterium]|jgi:hypothetical protein|nr:hypothetical protein [Lachnospiraceae bacterium]
MITFGEFAGTLITDFLQARKIADAYSAALSEEYYVNPVLRGMPVPHYTVDEAEIDVPMKIMGVRRAEITKEDLRNILVKIEQKLPVLLYRNIKNSYYEKQENIVFKKNGTIEAEQVGVAFDFGTDKKEKAGIIRLSQVPELKACYKASTASVCTLMNTYMKTYVEENNIGEMKLLDFTDAFIATLKSVCKQEFGTYPDEQTPFINKDSLKKMCETIGSAMFFEFREIFEQKEGILVLPETGKMESSSPEQLMRVKIKIKEQDVSFVVDRDESSGETKRFLTLG